MKKYIALFLLCLMVLNLAACGAARQPAQEAAPEGNTIGTRYYAVFANSAAADPKAMVAELLQKDFAGTELVEMEVSEGYLDGFREEISGFSAGVKFGPMIGAIPFVGYVLQSDAPEALLAKLQENADMAWNICTRADETVSGIRGDLVFFLMCSNEA